MYKCQLCGKTSQPKEPAYKVIIESGRTRYPFREKVNACWKWEKGRRKYVRTNDTGGIGLECVREVNACSACAAKVGVQSTNNNSNAPHTNGYKRRR